MGAVKWKQNMNKRIIMTIIGGSLVLATFTSWSRKRQGQRPRHVLAIGDSLTASAAYCSALKDLLPTGSTLTCRGLPGHGTRDILGALTEHMQPKTTDVVILAGVNDLASGRNVQDIKTNLETMYHFVKQQGARPVAVTLTPWSGHSMGKSFDAKTLELNNWIRRHKLPSAVVVTDSLGDFQGRLLETYSAKDGLHLSRAGSKELARLVAEQGL